MAARVAATAATLLSAALTVGAGPVYAAPGADPTVEFGGGSVLSLLVCKSEPSIPKVTVPTQSRVTFVNRLGQQATLKVDGKPVASVGPNQAVPVVFQYGPVNVAMTFSCGVGVVEDFKPVAVTVTAPPTKGAVAKPRAAATAGAAGAAGAAASAAAAGGAARAATAPSARSTRTAPTATVDPEAEPGATEPADPSLLGVDPAASPSALTAPLAGAESDERVVVEQPVPASGTPSNGPAGLLALVATVCVIGVGMAAIRAIIAQRSSRTHYA